MNRNRICGALAGLAALQPAHAESSLVLDSALGYTSNANLSQDAPQSDRILKVGGTLRFPVSTARGRFSLRYTDYGKADGNDMLAADLSSGWGDSSPAGAGKTYDLRVYHREYVRQNAGTTDLGFSHFGAGGSMTWPPAPKSAWKLGPRADVRNYTDGSRTDFDIAFLAENELELSTSPASSLSFGIAPGILASTSGDFSKTYLALTADFERALESSMFGAYVALTPSWYLTRETSSTVLVRSGKKASAMTVASKESTVFLSPGVWWSKDLSTDWEFRAETFLNFQSSKSGTFSYSEFQAQAGIRYRAF